MSQHRSNEPGIQAYTSSLAALATRVNFERLPPAQIAPSALKLGRMKALMDALGNPERRFRSIHVAGSKGKGSVCEMAAAALQGCGLRVGLYTSPHVVDIRERIRVNGAMISRADFAGVHRDVERAEAGVAQEHGPATYFEMLTAMAFVHLARASLDIAVIEVGLGGRLDSTNVLTPEAVAITAIQREHTQVLGNTLELIAGEKAGIFKAGVPAFTIPQAPEVIARFHSQAAEVGCHLTITGGDVPVRVERRVTGDRISLQAGPLRFTDLPVPLAGEHQAMNLALVLTVIGSLRGRARDDSPLARITEQGVATGLARTPNLARAEVVARRPTIVIDGAHTTESVTAILTTIRTQFPIPAGKLIVVFGCASDKDASGMLREIAASASAIILTRASDNKRAMEPNALRSLLGHNSGLHVEVHDRVETAMERARSLAVESGDGVLLATGSFIIAGEAKRWALDQPTHA